MKKISLIILLLITLACAKTEKGQNLTIDPMVVSVSNRADTTVELTVNSDGDWTLDHYDSNAIPSWFEMSPLSGEAGISTVTVKIVEANETTSERVSFIRFKTPAMTKVATIKQAALPVPVDPEEPVDPEVPVDPENPEEPETPENPQ